VEPPDPTSDVTTEPRRVSLPGARTLLVRPVSDDDLDGLAALYERVGGGLHRHVVSTRRSDRGLAQRLATIDSRGGFGLVAVIFGPGIPGEGQIVGQAGYEPLPNGDGQLELAMTAEWSGWPLPYLLDSLRQAAAARGVPNLEADLPAADVTMLALARSRGALAIPTDEWGSVRVIIGTRGRMPTWPGPHDRPRVLVEVPGGRWPAARAAQEAGLQVLTCPGPRNLHGCPVLRGERCATAAAADTIVVVQPSVDEWWRRLLDRHQLEHPGVPLCVAYHRNGAPPGAAPLPEDAGSPSSVVTLVDRLARAHAKNVCG
jgi:hypothetical protein